MRSSIVVVAAVLVLAGCSGDDAADPAATSASASPAPSASLSPASSPSASPSTAASPDEPAAPVGGPPVVVGDRIGGPGNPCNLWVAGDGRVWMPHLGGRVSGVDAETGEIVLRHQVRDQPCAVATVDDTVWVATLTRLGSDLPGHVVGVEADSGDEVATITVAGQPWDLIAGFDALWATLQDGNEVVRIDPVTAAITHTIEVGPTPTGLAASADRVWVAANGGDAPALVALDPTDGSEIDRVELGDMGRPLWVAADDTRVYTTTNSPFRVVAVDIASGEVAWSTVVADAPLDPALADGRVWVPHTGGELSVLDAADGRLLGVDDTGEQLAVAVSVGDEVWVPVYGAAGVLRYGPAEDW